MKTIRLKFEGPFGWFGPEGKVLFDQPVAEQYGIYIWTVPRPDGLLVNYIGETRISFKTRHKKHLREYLNGLWLRWTYDPRQFKNGEKRRIWEGTDHSGREEFARREEELTPQIKAFLSTMEIYVAPTLVDDLVRKRVESAIAIKIKEQPYPVGDFIDPDRRYRGNPLKDMRCLVEIQAPRKIIGLGSDVEVWLPKGK